MSEKENSPSEEGDTWGKFGEAPQDEAEEPLSSSKSDDEIGWTNAAEKLQTC